MSNNIIRKLGKANLAQMEKMAAKGEPFDAVLIEKVTGRFYNSVSYFDKEDVEEVINRFRRLMKVYNNLINDADVNTLHSVNLQHCRNSLSIAITMLENIKNKM